MKHLPFRILLLTILLPPFFYIMTMEAIQRLVIDAHLESAFAREIENIAVGDTRPLLRGNIRLKEAIAEHIQAYLEDQWLLDAGISARTAVITNEGTVLYPPFFDVHEDLMRIDPVEVAVDNLRLMNEGLTVQVDLRLGYDTWISFLVLVFYVSAASWILYFYYRRGIQIARQEDQEKDRELQRLSGQEQHHLENLKSLSAKRSALIEELKRLKQTLKQEKVKAERTEDEMVDEMIALEEKIQENLSRQQEQEAEIDSLKDQIRSLEALKSGPAKKAAALLQRRFKVLYKNLTVHDRAVAGFTDLEEDLKIKCEEVIHQLNEDAALVPVKRKVFSKKTGPTVLEVVFGYKGRLYFRSREGRVEVLVIGTKNTQAKDLDFINRL